MQRVPTLQLHVHDEDAAAQTYTFNTSRVTLGKDPGNLLCLGSAYVSRHHGVLSAGAGGWSYEDLGSTNGTDVVTEDHVARLGAGWPERRVPLRGGETLVFKDGLRIDVRVLPDGPADLEEHIVQGVSDPAQALRVLPEAGDLRLLFETVRSVSRCATSHEVLEVIAAAALDAMPSVTHVLFVDRDASGQRWEPHWTRHRNNIAPAQLPGVSQTLLDEAIERGISQLYVTHARSMPMPHSMVTEQISSSVCVPLRGLDGHLGLIQADCRGNAANLRERELHLMTLLAEQAAVMLDRLRITANIQRMFEGVVSASVKAIESRDPTTAGHSARVATYSLRVASAIDAADSGPFAGVRFGESDLRTLRYAALLHDFGKIAVPSDLLLKARKLPDATRQQIVDRFRLARCEVRARLAERKLAALMEHPAQAPALFEALEAEAREQLAWLETEEGWLLELNEPDRLVEPHAERLRALTREWHTAGVRLLEPRELEDMISCGRGTLNTRERLKMQEHASWTRCYLEEIPWSQELARVTDFASDHHEKLNGRGYPRGMKAREIPLQVRILTVCDIYDALTDRDRTYRTAMTPGEALGILDGDVRHGAVDGDVVAVLESLLRGSGVL